MLKRASDFAFGIVLLLVAVLLLNTYRHGSRQINVLAVQAGRHRRRRRGERLAGAVRIRTISYDDKPAAAEEFRKLHAYLEQHYPRAHAVLKREVVADLSLLYTWEGTDAAAKPIVLMAHQDVVPIAPDTEKDWQFEPFAGADSKRFRLGSRHVGRQGQSLRHHGSRGDTGRARIQAAPAHLSGLRARRGSGGRNGQKQIAALLKSRGVKADFVLDEGLLITTGVLKGLYQPVGTHRDRGKGVPDTDAVDGTDRRSFVDASVGTPRSAR
jgi:carboxypeptidase PM20D1